MDSHLSRLVLFLLIHLSLAAPGQPGSLRETSEDAPPPSLMLTNPFGSGEEERRLLRNYIKSSLTDAEAPEINSWEQEIFFLFRLYDFDHSGLLDGLEMMKLLFDYNSHQTPGKQANELVVSKVDFLLQTQDLNHDGLLAPSELLSPSLPHTQDSNTRPEQEEQQEQKEQQQEEKQKDEEPGEEINTGEEEAVKKETEMNEQQVPAAEQDPQVQDPSVQDPQVQDPQVQDPVHQVSVHQGQPEI